MSDWLNLRQDSPFRPCAWRWRRATLLVDERARPCRGGDDAYVRRAAAFEARRRRAQSRRELTALADEFPALLWAYGVYADRPAESHADEPTVDRLGVEAWLLTGAGDVEVAQRGVLEADAVRWYEALFFNVRDRLDRRGWVLQRVLGPDLYLNLRETNVGLFWKLLGYQSGPHVLQAAQELLDHAGRPRSPDQVPGYRRDMTRAALEQKGMAAALCLRPHDVYSRLQMLELQHRYLELQQNAGASGAQETMLHSLDAFLQKLPWQRRKPAPEGAEPPAAEPRAADLLDAMGGAPPPAPLSFPKAPRPAAPAGGKKP